MAKTIFDFEAKVGARTYKVEPIDRETETGRGADGLHMPVRGVIGVIDYVPRDYQIQVFLHELLHAIESDRGIELGDDKEKITDGLANGIAAFIVDNPELCKTIGEYLLKK